MNNNALTTQTCRNILLVGGNSAIGEAIARQLAHSQRRIVITGRDPEQLQATAADLLTRGYTQALWLCFDPGDPQSDPTAILAKATAQLGELDTLIWTAGAMADETHDVRCLENTERIMRVNATAAIVMAASAARAFQARGAGTIVAISSVAADRGRATNALYGSAKAALATYLSGLSQAMHGTGVQVLCVKPGLIDTPMTADFIKSRLWASPQRVARDVERALKNRRHNLRTPWFWSPIILVIRLLPGFIFRRLRF